MKTQFLKTAAFTALLSLSTQANAAQDVCYGTNCNQKGLQANAGVSFTKFNPKCVQFAKLINKVADLANKIGFDVENDDYSTMKPYHVSSIQMGFQELRAFYEDIEKKMLGISALESCGADFQLLTRITFHLSFLKEFLEKTSVAFLLDSYAAKIVDECRVYVCKDLFDSNKRIIAQLNTWLNGDM